MTDTESGWSVAGDVDPNDMLYVADRDLSIVYTNEEWSRFAGANNGARLLGDEWQPRVLDNMSGRERGRWASIYAMLLDGRLPFHEERFNCSSPAQRRIYKLRITPQRDRSGEVAWLVHHAVPVGEEADRVRALAKALQSVTDSPEEVASVYRRHVVERMIDIRGFRLARHLQPVEDVGGDFLWHRQYADSSTDVVHGDAMGHGRAAALLAAKAVLILPAAATAEASPSRVVSEFNRLLVRSLPEDEVLFATGLLLRFRPDVKRLKVCAFGHDGVLFSRTGKVPLETGPPVGLAEETEEWPETQVDLEEHGNRFLVFSDGITEQFNAGGELFGVDRLLEVFHRTVHLPIEETLRTVLQELETFRGSALIKDDRTLVAIEYGELPSEARV